MFWYVMLPSREIYGHIPPWDREIIDAKVPWDTTSPGGPNDKGRYTVEVMVADDESLGSNGRQKWSNF